LQSYPEYAEGCELSMTSAAENTSFMTTSSAGHFRRTYYVAGAGIWERRYQCP